MAIEATWNFNGEKKVILGSRHRLWCFLFGPFHYLFKGMFLWAILSLITANGLWIGFPFFNRAIVLRHFHRKGWVQPMSKPTHTAPKSVPANGPDCGPIEKTQISGSVSPLTA